MEVSAANVPLCTLVFQLWFLKTAVVPVIKNATSRKTTVMLTNHVLTLWVHSPVLVIMGKLVTELRVMTLTNVAMEQICVIKTRLAAIQDILC